MASKSSPDASHSCSLTLALDRIGGEPCCYTSKPSSLLLDTQAAGRSQVDNALQATSRSQSSVRKIYHLHSYLQIRRSFFPHVHSLHRSTISMSDSSIGLQDPSALHDYRSAARRAQAYICSRDWQNHTHVSAHALAIRALIELVHSQYPVACHHTGFERVVRVQGLAHYLPCVGSANASMDCCRCLQCKVPSSCLVTRTAV